MASNQRPSPIDPNDFDAVFREAEDAVDHLHSSLAHGVEHAAFMREAIQVARRVYAALAQRASEEPELVPIVHSGLQFVQALSRQLRTIDRETSRPLIMLVRASNSTASFSASSEAIPALYDSGFAQIRYLGPSGMDPASRAQYASRFDGLSAGLGGAYSQAWQSRAGGGDDPSRSAMFMMRQTFDHFFEALAPDEDVRRSQYWHPKTVGDPRAIHRSERIQYAAHTHISDGSTAELLAASAQQMLEVYEALNAAHKRGIVDSAKADNALRAMSSMLENWLDAVDDTGSETAA